MQFLFNEEAGISKLSLRNEAFLHLKVRRVKENESVSLRNFKDNFLHIYKIINLSKNHCDLELIKSEKSVNLQSDFKLALSVIDPKNIEKILPFLNELGLFKLIFVYSDFSQRNFKLDLERFKRILINSCEQCGRDNLMQIEIFKSSKDFAKAYENAVLIDFLAKKGEFDKTKLYFIGPEAGFSKDERELFKDKISLNCPNILRSHSVAISLCAKILL